MSGIGDFGYWLESIYEIITNTTKMVFAPQNLLT